MIELLYRNGLSLVTGDATMTEKAKGWGSREERDATRFVLDAVAASTTGRVLVRDRSGEPVAVVLSAEIWAAIVGHLP